MPAQHPRSLRHRCPESGIRSPLRNSRAQPLDSMDANCKPLAMALYHRLMGFRSAAAVSVYPRQVSHSWPFRRRATKLVNEDVVRSGHKTFTIDLPGADEIFNECRGNNNKMKNPKS